MISIRTIAVVLFGSFFVAGLLPPEISALERKRSLEHDLITECKRKLKPEVETCKALDAEEQDPDSFILESCMQEALKYYEKCMKDAKKEAEANAPEKNKKEKKKKELLKRWTF